MPIGSARVRSTAIVCGWVSRSTKNALLAFFCDPMGQRHRFGCGGGFIEQRRVGQIKAGEVADHRLEVEQRLQATLADLGLVRRVGRVPGRVLQDVAGSPAV